MNNKSLVCIVLGIFVALAWYMGIDNATASSSGYKSYIRSAEKYEKEELYQLAINDYRTAITYEDNLKIRLKICELYRLGLDNGEISGDGNLVSMYTDTMSTYPKESSAYDAAADYFFSILDYDELINVLQTAQHHKVNSKQLKEVENQVRYMYEKNYSTFSAPTQITNGYHLIFDAKNNYSVARDLSIHMDDCDFISPYSSGGFTVAKRDGRVFVVDLEGVRRVYLDSEISDSSGIADGRIACFKNDMWSYYDTNGEKISGDYIFASRFSNGVAAVQEKEGEWRLINTEFEYLTQDVYTDVKLNEARACVSGAVVFVNSGDKYTMLSVNGYDAESGGKVKLEAVKGFSCDDCDLPVDAATGSNNGKEWFAYKSGGKWGYADCEGKVQIEPKFAAAKSFSNGYAGVSEDGEKWNFADTEGNVVIKTQATNVGYFSTDGICFVQFDSGYWTYIRMYYWS